MKFVIVVIMVVCRSWGGVCYCCYNGGFAGPGVEFVIVIMVVCRSCDGVCYCCYNGGLQVLVWTFLLLL